MNHPLESLVLINMVVSAAIFYMALCRLNKASKCVRVAVRAYYSLLLMGSMANGLQTVFFGQYPTVATTLFATCVAFGMTTGIRRWGKGAPEDTKKVSTQPPECCL